MSDGGEGLLDVLGGANRTTIVTGPLGRAGRGGVAARAPHRRDRDGQGQRPRPRRRRRGQRSARRDHRGHRRADRPGARAGRPTHHRRPRRLGDDRRRTRRRRGAAQPGPTADGRAGGRLRRAHPLRRRGGRVRPAEGRPPGAGRPADGPAGAARHAVPRAVRRRRDRARRRRRGRWARRWPRRARRPARRWLRARRRARRPRGAGTSRRRGRHRRGPPRRAEPRRQGRRWRVRPRRTLDRPAVVIVGDADDDAAAELRSRPNVTVISLVERFGEHRAFTEPRWCIEHAAADAIRVSRARQARTTHSDGRKHSDGS